MTSPTPPTPPTPPTSPISPAPGLRDRAEERAALSVVGALTSASVSAGFALGGAAVGLLVLAAVVLLVGAGATLLRRTGWAWATGRTAAGFVAAGAVAGLLIGGLAAPRAPLQPTSATVSTTGPGTQGAPATP